MGGWAGGGEGGCLDARSKDIYYQLRSLQILD